MARMSPDVWTHIRTRWECDPREGYIWLIREMELDVTKAAIRKKADKEKWSKRATLKAIVNRAQLKADQLHSKIGGMVEGIPVSDQTEKLVSAYTEESIDLRSQVIDTHRQEWTRHRKEWDVEVFKQAARIVELKKRYADSDMTPEEIMQEVQSMLDKGYDVDPDWVALSYFQRCAKTAAETVKIRQEGERKAWGLDATAEDTTSGAETPEQLDARIATARKRRDEQNARMAEERKKLNLNGFTIN